MTITSTTVQSATNYTLWFYTALTSVAFVSFALIRRYTHAERALNDGLEE